MMLSESGQKQPALEQPALGQPALEQQARFKTSGSHQKFNGKWLF